MPSRPPHPDQLPLLFHPPGKSYCTHETYGLTCELYDLMRFRAGDRCEICRARAQDVQRRPLYIDHDSRLGNGWNHVRGLLCARCNNHMRWVDGGQWMPTPEQRSYVENAWFWVLVPPEWLDEPYFPAESEDPEHAAKWAQTPHYRRRQAAIAKAKAEGRRLRSTHIGTLIWWE